MRTDDFERHDPARLALLCAVDHAQNAVSPDSLWDAGSGAQATDTGFPHLLLGIADHTADSARVILAFFWGMCIAHDTTLNGRKRRAAVTVNL